jgi:uncharacterized repeat protein (TIGR01451 family)
MEPVLLRCLMVLVATLAALTGRGAAQPDEQAPAKVPTNASPQRAETAVPLVKLETVAPPSISLGQPLEYQIVVRNIGTIPAFQVRVDDRIPPGAQLRSADPQPEIQGDRLAWSLGELAPGKEVRLRITVTPSAEGEVAWSATVSYSATAAFTTRVTRPRLEVRKTGPHTALLGDTAAFQIQIKNTGSGPASSVCVRDQLPAGLRHPQGAVVEADLGTLAPGETRSITLQVTAVAPGNFANEVIVTADGGYQATARAEIAITQPILALRKTGPAHRFIGREAEFDLEVHNPGTADAVNVQVVDSLPDGLDWGAASDNGTFDATARTVTWALGTIPAGQRRGLTLKASAGKAGDWTNRAVARAERVADVPAEAVLRVEGVPALMLEVVDLDDPIEVGAETSYEIRVVNQGSSASTNLQIIATVPDGMKAEQASGPTEYQQNGQTISFKPLPKLAAHADAVYRVKVRGLKAGDWRFKVQMLSDQLQAPVREDESTRVYDDENE